MALRLGRIPILIPAGLLIYIAAVIHEIQHEDESRLWPDLWSDAVGLGDDPAEALLFVILLFSAFGLFWLRAPRLPTARSLVSLASTAISLVFAALGAFGLLLWILDFPTDYTFSAGGQSLVAFGMIYLLALLGLRRVLEVIPNVLKEPPMFVRRVVAVGICLLLFVGWIIGIAGSISAIGTYALYRYHSG